jgi:hypothetical protein
VEADIDTPLCCSLALKFNSLELHFNLKGYVFCWLMELMARLMINLCRAQSDKQGGLASLRSAGKDMLTKLLKNNAKGIATA